VFGVEGTAADGGGVDGGGDETVCWAGGRSAVEGEKTVTSTHSPTKPSATATPA
jgi:hypothetical protein